MKLSVVLLFAVSVVACLVTLAQTAEETGRPPFLVIQEGTLIDGTGASGPIENFTLEACFHSRMLLKKWCMGLLANAHGSASAAPSAGPFRAATGRSQTNGIFQ